MALIYYDTMLVISLIFTIIYAYVWRKRFDVNFTLIFTFIPIANSGYMLLAYSDTFPEAITALKLMYLSACFLPFFVLMSVMKLCDIEIGKIVTSALVMGSTCVCLSIFTIGKSDLFYKKAEIANLNGATIVTNKEYGFMHTVFYIMILLYYTVSLFLTIYSYIRKRNISKRIIRLLLIPESFTLLTFFGQKIVDIGIDLIPLVYVTAQFVFLLIINRVNLYDVTDTVIDSLVQTNETGLISLDKNKRYLGCNSIAAKVFPELTGLTVDRFIDPDSALCRTILVWLGDFINDETHDKAHFEKDGKIYLIDINYLYQGSRKRGYQFVITDDTKNQQYITLINRYNADLRDQVAEKTKHIVEMHDKLVLGMAAMVESRDNSTGGHIKRTSDVVKILIDEIKRDNTLKLDDEFCRNIIKAAPMHDLGKIAVDDAILRKPGRFTDEEFEKMKVHAAEGAKIVHTILEGTDDINFHIIAENVAHYHHERWDGSGYPEGLKGEEIPIEARIMAIADVYDALVSKRVYKESMSFDKADSIIMDGMGKHFDERFKPYYMNARPRLEKYYSEQEKN